MPTGRSWTNFIYVNLGFVCLVAFMYYSKAIVEIKKDWPKYRCNPLYMPLSDDMSQDFTYCVQNSQVNMMGYLLQPITYLISNITNVGGEFSQNLNSMRGMFSNVRGFISTIVDGVFGVFINLVIQFQKISLSIKDTIGKIIGVVITFMFVLDGANKTMVSAWAGPPGQTIRAMGSFKAPSIKCFHPDTKIILENGQTKMIKDIALGDIIKGQSKVMANIQFSNSDNETLYRLKDIFVTGHHYVLKPNGNPDNLLDYIKVKEHPDAILDPSLETDILICLITDNNNIYIDDYIFWDWEDDCITDAKKTVIMAL